MMKLIRFHQHHQKQYLLFSKATCRHCKAATTRVRVLKRTHADMYSFVEYPNIMDVLPKVHDALKMIPTVRESTAMIKRESEGPTSELYFASVCEACEQIHYEQEVFHTFTDLAGTVIGDALLLSEKPGVGFDFVVDEFDEAFLDDLCQSQLTALAKAS